MAITYTYINKITPGTGTSTIDFTNIPQTYNNLIVIMYGQILNAGTLGDLVLQVNNQFSTPNAYVWQGFTNYSTTTTYYGYSSTTLSLIDAVVRSNSSNAAAGIYITINNYAINGNQKPITYTSSSPWDISSSGVNHCFGGGRITYTSPVTSLQLIVGGGNYAAKTSAWLYGVKNT